MAKIILANGDTVLREVLLSKERITIGRGPFNDIVINSLAISAQHAVIVTQNNDSFLEDLNSTNGTKVNGQPVRKHFLQSNDVLELAHYRIRYVGNAAISEAEQHQDEFASRTCLVPATTLPCLRVMDGVKAGQETVIAKALTTIGHPDRLVAAVMQRIDEYYIAYVEGSGHLLVNGKPVGLHAHLIRDGDVIDLAGTRMQFLMSC